MKGETVGRRGVGIVAIQCEHPDKVIASASDFAWGRKNRLRICSGREFSRAARNKIAEMIERGALIDGEDVILLQHRNAYVNTGLNNSLDREFGLGGTAIGYIGVSSNTTAVTAATVNLNGASGGTAANTIILAISPAATRSSQTVTGGASFVNASFTSGVFVQNKIGLLTTSTDAGTGLVDVIGGTGGSSPYNRTFSLDLTSAGTFTEVAQIAVTAVAV